MKKFFAFAITVLAMVAVFSSCKKDDLTDDQYIANIAANANYKGTFEFEGQKYTAAAVFLNAGGVKTFAIDDDTHISEDAGTWTVTNGQLIMNSSADEKIKYTGTIKDGGNKLEITSGSIVFKLEKYTK